MTVRVEFYGIARRRSGVESLDVEAANLGELFAQVAERLPALSTTCFANGRLKDGYLANINGQQFASAVETPLDDGDTVLILSADAGG